LLVVDYAEGRQETVLRVLDTALERSRIDGRPITIGLLLLARSHAWWPALPRRADCSADVAALLAGAGNVGVEALPPWQGNLAVRSATYHAALEDFASAQGIAVPRHAYVPDLADSMFERPLYLHMAAIAALEGERPNHQHSLLDSQLRREWRYWLKSRQGPATSYDDWADALAWLGLTQGATIEDATSVFADLDFIEPRLGSNLAGAYPSQDGSIGTLQPNLLVEALIVERLAAKRGSRVLDAAMLKDRAIAANATPIWGARRSPLSASSPLRGRTPASPALPPSGRHVSMNPATLRLRSLSQRVGGAQPRSLAL